MTTNPAFLYLYDTLLIVEYISPLVCLVIIMHRTTQNMTSFIVELTLQIYIV
jgi:hypothetical protein